MFGQADIGGLSVCFVDIETLVFSFACTTVRLVSRTTVVLLLQTCLVRARQAKHSLASMSAISWNFAVHLLCCI